MIAFDLRCFGNLPVRCTQTGKSSDFPKRFLFREIRFASFPKQLTLKCQKDQLIIT